ncbi:MAG: hypothetical protein OES69_12965 [Myxococcales bacterium]|nr:hypothetical protein [Myxococcales bacterium]MDH3844847.1 hypothetical protein [Myxococcales bacterium]
MKRPRKQEGAALFIVLMIVMVGTASAVFSATTVSHEVRGTGFARQQMQTRHTAKAGLTAAMDWFDIFGPETVRNLMLAPGSTEGVTFTCASGGTCYPEIPMANGRRAYRLYPEHFSKLTAAGGGPGLLVNEPYEQATSFGAFTALTPIVTIDIYDEHIISKLAPGAAAQGGSKFKYMRTTLTARARARVAAGDVAKEAADQERERNETGADFRAYIVSGPFATGS